MSTSQIPLNSEQQITPPPSFVNPPPTPPPTNEKAFTQASRVLSLFKDIQFGRHNNQDSWRLFQLAPGEFEDIERRLTQDRPLFGYIKDKTGYDYNARTCQLIVRMPTGLHEIFIDRVEDAIRSQLKAVRKGSGQAARFAQKVFPARSTEIFLPVDENPSRMKSKYEPDASFCHIDAKYPGAIFEVAYSQQKKLLARLAEDYLLDSDASVQIVVGLDIGYGKKVSRKATLSIWRTETIHSSDGSELRVVQVVTDEAFRDDQGSPTNSPGLQMRLSDFACEELTKDWSGTGDKEIMLSSQELCHSLAAAEERGQGQIVHAILPGVKKRKRSETPPEEIASEDERMFVEQEQRAAKRMAEDDGDYEDTPLISTSSD